MPLPSAGPSSGLGGSALQANALVGPQVLWSRAFGNPSAPLVIGLVRCPEGRLEIPAAPAVRVSISLGPSVHLSCRADGRLLQGREVPGDLFVMPAGAPTSFESDGASTALVLNMPGRFLARLEHADGPELAAELGRHSFARDPQLEHIGRALVTEIEAGCPSGDLFLEGLGIAAASRLLSLYGPRSPRPQLRGGLPNAKLRRLLAYIEDNLAGSLSIVELAGIAELSASHLKAVFRQATGIPVHRYVVRRRVERAQALLRDTSLPVSDVAQAAGFAHQSHLARHMRNLLGVSPAALRRGIAANAGVLEDPLGDRARGG